MHVIWTYVILLCLSLCRWNLIIHGGIDGHTRLIVYLKCSNNNRAETVFQCFQEAVENFGLPSRIRADRGGENVRVADYMLMHPERGPDRGSFITGRSVHNSRIERFWRDLFQGCTILYYNLFSSMEDEGILDVDDIIQLFCLHYIFLKRINFSMSKFVDAWNKHPMESVGGLSPEQQWVVGMAQYHGTVTSLTPVSHALRNMCTSCL